MFTEVAAEAKDRPEPVSRCWNHWIAVSAGDRAGVMDVLGLSSPRPVTFAEARQMIDADGHGDPTADLPGSAW
ncbi:hypothetical protein [Planomonospora sp. ID82291]|uniref:hypothetical protein n=1 Tax=Planomonospora sp. ID82291 TaxID=2738136 RepID=UPI0018C39603|nr:hypothetical protein [Planomonospora sp. ID82291]MBG0814918.1 hypothetical protein [Planomonospora sp. ID82291]